MNFYTFLVMVVNHPPLRLEYPTLQVVHSRDLTDEPGNYIVHNDRGTWRLVLRDFKTNKSGFYEEKLGPKINKHLNKWRRRLRVVDGKRYLFQKKNGQHWSRNAFGKFIKKHFT